MKPSQFSWEENVIGLIIFWTKPHKLGAASPAVGESLLREMPNAHDQ